MALKSKARIERELSISVSRARKIREAAQKLKGAATTTEGETATTQVSLIKPTFSPSRQN